MQHSESGCALARLPNHELVEIETVYDEGYARVIRVYGDRAGTVAVCHISKLEAASEGDKSFTCARAAAVPMS